MSDSKDTNLTLEEQKAINWRILSSLKVKVFEIYSDGTETKVTGSTLASGVIIPLSVNASNKKIIARKFRFEGITPKCYEAYSNRHDLLKTGLVEQVLAYRIVHSHSVEIEEIYSRGLLGGMDFRMLGGLAPSLSIGGTLEKIKGRKFCFFGEIIILKIPVTPPVSASPTPIFFKVLLKFTSVLLYGFVGLIVVVTLFTWLNNSLTSEEKLSYTIFDLLLCLILSGSARFSWKE
ncbi:hypothetical protein CFPU101_41390 [Chroococcus sp. FPU101]|nr:hypothetical protein CFPU101_41390 [Chroococcus sp. FPU101]